MLDLPHLGMPNLTLNLNLRQMGITQSLVALTENENDFILMYKNWDMKILWPNFFGGQDIIGKSFGFAHTRKKKGLEN